MLQTALDGEQTLVTKRSFENQDDMCGISIQSYQADMAYLQKNLFMMLLEPPLLVELSTLALDAEFKIED